MIDTHFSNSQALVITLGWVFILTGLYFYFVEKTKLSLLFIIIGGAIFRFLMVFIDPFLHNWDEQFHALVSSNLTHHFLKPTLYEYPLHNYSSGEWANNNIWLHKPPLFLWQIAISILLFGKTYWAVRIPSAVLSIFIIPAVFRMGKLIFSERAGLLAALFLTISNIHLHVISGRLNTDHNDVVFMCYVTLSFWAFIEYYFSNKTSYSILTGLFSGMAILVKWLPGFMVFALWFLTIIMDKDRLVKIVYWKTFVIAFLTCAFTSIPWFFYAAHNWHNEFKAFNDSNTEHLFSVIASHEGPWWYYFSELHSQFGLFLFFSLCGFLLLYKRSQHKTIFISILFLLISVLTFYCFVKTKMPLFTFPVSCWILIFGAATVEYISNNAKVRFKKFLAIILLAVLSFNLFDLGKIEYLHTNREEKDLYWKTKIFNSPQLIKAVELLKNKNCVVFNCGGYNHISYMYYSGQTAYSFIPDKDLIDDLQRKNIAVAVFDSPDLPSYIKEDLSIIKLPFELIRNSF